jgi:nucleosome binding factor SPN SPT16 subunit
MKYHFSDKNTLHFGAIICSLGAKYRHYCSNITRTLFVNPSDELKVNNPLKYVHIN